jgi:hypothetical protein
MAIPILHFWENYYENPDEGLGSTYERFIINRILFKTVKHFKIKSVLETPSFGFTGLSGINSMYIAKQDCNITIMHHNQKRLDYIQRTWKDLELPFTGIYTEDYSSLPFEEKTFDMSWNFSALWFVNDLSVFLKELDRVSKKVILLMVPNQTGIGYLQQKYFGQDDLKKYLNEDYIKVHHIKSEMKKLKWKLLSHELLDCPLWPDIGMSKEDFLKKLKLSFLLPKKPSAHIKKEPVSILDYYSGKRPDMPKDFEKFEFFEKNAPHTFKKIWAHHQYLLFVR